MRFKSTATYREFLEQFVNPDEGARLLRASELAMRLNPGSLAHESLTREVRARRLEIFVGLLEDDLVAPVLQS